MASVDTALEAGDLNDLLELPSSSSGMRRAAAGNVGLLSTMLLVVVSTVLRPRARANPSSQTGRAEE